MGNPLITATPGNKSGIKAPLSPGSTFSKTEFLNPKKTMPSSTTTGHQYTVSPNASFSEREAPSTMSRDDSSFVPLHIQNETTMLVGSTITTGPAIGLPSHYPGSAGHNRNNSLESSVLMEELQDFDDIFEQGPQPPDSSDGHVDEKERKSFSASIQGYWNDDDDDLHMLSGNDDDDDLNMLSESLPSRLTLQHRREVSELSISSNNNPLSAVVLEQTRSTVGANSVYSNSSTQRSSSIRTTSTIRSHRRSRNLAMGSQEFQNAVLESLEN